MAISWQHPDGTVRIEETQEGRRRLTVTPAPHAVGAGGILSWDTSYPLDLIRAVFDVKGALWVCDELRREEDPSYLCFDDVILGYLDPAEFSSKTILDFGCGAGASTVTLARMFPDAHVIGVELEETLIRLASRRAEHYSLKNVRLLLSPGGDRLPPDMPQVDFIVMCGVFEHMFPAERATLMPALWSLLRPGGVLFLPQTPNRYSPIESHTTCLPLVNYLPRFLAHPYARRFSKKVRPDQSWESLLRCGIRGGSVREIRRLLASGGGWPMVLEPSRGGLRDRIDLWYVMSTKRAGSRLKKWARQLLKVVRRCCGVTFLPYLFLAIRKIGEGAPAAP